MEIETHIQTFIQKQIARELGGSDSTIKRYRNNKIMNGPYNGKRRHSSQLN